MKRLLLLTDGGLRHASSRTRGLGYVPMLEAAGYAVTWIPRRPDDAPLGALGRAVGKRWNALRRFWAVRQRWDVVVAQRFGATPGDLVRARARGATVVYDFDDAIFLGMGHDPVAALVRLADRVVVSTPALVPFCQAHRSPEQAPPLVLPTPVETDRLVPASVPPATPTIGWIGSSWTTKYLVPLAPVLVELAQTHPFRLRLVGADAAQLPPLPGVAVDVVPWRLEAEAADLQAMTVGVMPLPDDAWAAGKGAYKLYQYMAAGLPVVASPVGLNAEVVRAGANGLLATTPAEWADALARLLEDPALCARLGAAGRADAEVRYARRVVFRALLAGLAETSRPVAG